MLYLSSTPSLNLKDSSICGGLEKDLDIQIKHGSPISRKILIHRHWNHWIQQLCSTPPRRLYRASFFPHSRWLIYIILCRDKGGAEHERRKASPAYVQRKNSAPRAPLITHIHHWQKVGQWKSWQLQRLQVPRSQKQPELPECVPGFGPMNGGVHTHLMSEHPSSRDESTARLAFGN